MVWSWNMQAPNAQIHANTKYISIKSLLQSGGVFSGTSKHCSKWHSIWMCDISAIGVTWIESYCFLTFRAKKLKPFWIWFSWFPRKTECTCQRESQDEFFQLGCFFALSKLSHICVKIKIKGTIVIINQDLRIPAKILRVYVENSSPRDCGWCSCFQVGYFKEKAHLRGESDSLVAGQRQHFIVVHNCIQRFNPHRVYVAIQNDPFWAVRC